MTMDTIRTAFELVDDLEETVNETQALVRAVAHCVESALRPEEHDTFTCIAWMIDDRMTEIQKAREKLLQLLKPLAL